MFGLLYVIGSVFRFVSGSCVESYKKSQKKSEGRLRKNLGNNPENTYYDWHGIERDLDTDDIRHTRRDYNTHNLVVEDMYGRKIRDLTQEEIDSKWNLTVERYKNGNESRIALYDDRYNSFPYYKGQIYRDCETGKKYIKYRRNKNMVADYWMDCETGQLISAIEGTEIWNATEDNIKRDIEMINNLHKNKTGIFKYM